MIARNRRNRRDQSHGDCLARRHACTRKTATSFEFRFRAIPAMTAIPAISKLTPHSQPCRLLTGVGMPFAEKPAQDEGHDTNLSFAGGHAAKGEPK